MRKIKKIGVILSIGFSVFARAEALEDYRQVFNNNWQCSQLTKPDHQFQYYNTDEGKSVVATVWFDYISRTVFVDLGTDSSSGGMGGAGGGIYSLGRYSVDFKKKSMGSLNGPVNTSTLLGKIADLRNARQVAPTGSNLESDWKSSWNALQCAELLINQAF